MMPVMHCQKNGKPGYKWGKSGTCYTYEYKDTRSESMAKQKALAQGRAIEASKVRNK